MRPAGQGFEHFQALERAGVNVSWDGRRVTAPPGVVGPDGFADLTLPLAGKKRD